MNEPRDLVLGTAGHIDHGKTALVRALTGVDTDRLPAEKQRGITIDLGFAALETCGHRLAMVDVPGHERFIRNMLAGATGLDLALLVVAADDSVMPQTREHLEILRLLGLPAGVVALTKCDLADPAWLDLVEEEVRGLIAGTFLAGAEVVRTSATTGAGIDALKRALGRLCAATPARADPGPFRMAIDRSFTVAGHGTVVTGTVASGTVAVGDDLEWLPEGRTVRVRGLHRHDRPVVRVGRGARAAINLGGVHHSEVRRGQELATPGYLAATRILSVEVRASADAPRPLRHRGRYRLHLGTAEVSATLSLLEGPELVGGGTMSGQLFLAEPVVAVHGQPLVLREESPPATLGGGRVLQPLARRLRRRDLASRDLLARLAGSEPGHRVEAALAGYGLGPWTERTLCRDSGLALGTVASVMAGLSESGALVELAIGPRRTVRLLAEVVAALEDRLLRALGRLHGEHPRQTAIGRSRVAAALADLRNDALVAGLIDRLTAAGKVTSDARTVALAGHEPKLSQAERRLKAELAEAIRAGGLSPPDPSELVTRAGARAAVVPELLALLVDEERLVAVGKELYLDFDVAAVLRRRVIDRLADGSSMTMAELRDLLGTTRKYAVPVGEYLDRIGLTRREGDTRRLIEGAVSQG
jgi:selenocysteine-specific elongation factor